MMLPIPWLSLMVASLVAPDRLTKKDSSDSALVSPLIVTEIVCVLTLAPKCSVPALAT